MASTIRPSTLRHFLNLKHPIAHRHSTQVHAIRFLQTPTSPIFEKYRTKLEAKIKSAGVNTFEELRETIKAQTQQQSASTTPTVQSPPTSTSTSTPTPTPTTTTSTSAKAPPGIKTLASFLDVDKLHALPTEEIEYIWQARFMTDPQSLCAVIPHDKYTRMETDARKHPMFLLPLPRDGHGAEMHFLQWSFPSRSSSTIIFTSLAEYRLRGEWATPHTTLTHHLELAQANKVVLSQGAVAKECGVSVDQARWLVFALQRFYGVGDGEAGVRRKRMLEMFSNGDCAFNVEDLISEVEMIE